MRHGNLYKSLIMLLMGVILLSWGRSMLKKDPPQKQQGKTTETQTVYPETEEEKTIQTSDSKDNAVISPDVGGYPDAGVEEWAEAQEMKPEIYAPWEGGETSCYFVNTETTIDAGGVLPVNAQGRLIEETQKYLDGEQIEATELYCIDQSVRREGANISFLVQCDDANHTLLTITYNRDLHTWTFKK